MKNQDPLLKKKRFTPKAAGKAVGRFATDTIEFAGNVIVDAAPLVAIGALATGAVVFGNTKMKEEERAKPSSTPIEVVQSSSIAEDVPIHIGNGNVLTLPPNPTVNGIHYPKNPPGNGLLPR